MANKTILLLFSLAVLPGCLQTRADLRRDPEAAKSVTAGPAVTSAPIVKTAPMAAAQSDMRFDELNKDFRDLNGRIEVLEKETKDTEKSKNLEVKIAQLETKIGLLEATIAELNMKSKKEAAAPAKKEDDFTEANKLFDDKKWEDAILAFEEYRKNNPKGKAYPEATYKIGVSFQSLGMKDDAKAFFKEVADKFPASKEAGLAKSKLKKI